MPGKVDGTADIGAHFSTGVGTPRHYFVLAVPESLAWAM
jgi:hypothetical protein